MGVADNASDILYSGETGVWSFDLGGIGISFSDYSTATLTASLILEDLYSEPTSNYSLEIDLLGTNIFSGPTDSINLIHGSPYGSVFSNWTSASFDTSSLADPFTVSMKNTSLINPSHWIGIDYIELELTPASVPEPTTILLFCTGIAGLVGSRLRRKKK